MKPAATSAPAGSGLSYDIQILHDRKAGPFRKIDGFSGAKFVFNWDERRRAYVFSPSNQAQSDDIFRTQGRVDSTVYAPINKPAGIEEEDEAPKDPVPAEVSEAAVLRGVVFTEDDDSQTVIRLVQAHDAGFAKGEETAAAKLTTPKRPGRNPKPAEPAPAPA